MNNCKKRSCIHHRLNGSNIKKGRHSEHLYLGDQAQCLFKLVHENVYSLYRSNRVNIKRQQYLFGRIAKVTK